MVMLNLAITGQALIERDLRSIRHPGLDRVVELLRHADLALTNLECAIAGRHGGKYDRARLNHMGPPTILDTLCEWGFDTIALASNHAYDLGPQGIRTALEETATRGLLCAGTGLDAAAAARPGVAARAGVSVALVAMTAAERPPGAAAVGVGNSPGKPGVNPLRVVGSAVAAADRERNLDAIAREAADGRFVIAYIHQHYWAHDWRDVPNWLVPFAHDCVDAGAAVVVVHGVPVLQAIAVYRNRLILFGLGNFVFHTHRPHKYPGHEVWEGVVVTASFESTAPALAELALHPIIFGHHPALVIDDQRLEAPIVAPRAVAEQILERVTLLSRSFPDGVSVDASGHATWRTDLTG